MIYIYSTTPNLTYTHFSLLVPEKKFQTIKSAKAYLYSCGFKVHDIRKLGIAFFRWEGSAPDWFEVPISWEGGH